MMKAQTMIFAIVCLITISCRVQTPNKGEVVVRKDDVLWEVRIFADKEDCRFNVALTQASGECIKAQLTIEDIPNKTGVYVIRSVASGINKDTLTARFSTLDCDVLLRTYETKDSPTFENFIEVTKVKKNCIAGKFQVMLSARGNENDTIRFTEGVFETRTIK